MNTQGHEERMSLAGQALEGLSVGDAFGERFFVHPDVLDGLIADRVVPRAPWRWTDDTAMALSVFESLDACGGVDADDLSARFAARYNKEPVRGYGGGAHRLFGEIAAGVPWRVASSTLFEGGGSFGNGAAMRVAPIGAYFSYDSDLAAQHASRSAEPTHAHVEGSAGAIAVAVATGWATSIRGNRADADEMFGEVLARTPKGEVYDVIVLARDTPLESSVALAVSRLGNGSRVSAQDTVGFTLWCAARHLGDFKAGMWATVEGKGDRDTTCAIVGGILAAFDGGASIPLAWRDARETLGLPNRVTTMES